MAWIIPAISAATGIYTAVTGANAQKKANAANSKLGDIGRQQWQQGAPYRSALGQEWAGMQPLYGSILSYLMDPTGKTAYGTIPALQTVTNPASVNKERSVWDQLMGKNKSTPETTTQVWGSEAAPTGAGIASWLPYYDAANPFTAQQKGSLLGAANTDIGLAAQNLASRNAIDLSRRGLAGIGTTSTSDRNALIGLENSRRNALADANADFTRAEVQRADYLKSLNAQTFANLMQYIMGNLSTTADLGQMGVSNAMNAYGNAGVGYQNQANAAAQGLGSLASGLGAYYGMRQPTGGTAGGGLGAATGSEVSWDPTTGTWKKYGNI